MEPSPDPRIPQRAREAAERASRVLAFYVDDEYDEALREIRELFDSYGSEGIFVALLAWCDAYADHASAGLTRTGGRRAPMFMLAADGVSTGAVTSVDHADLPPEVAWCGRLIRARCAMDLAETLKLWYELPNDDIGPYVVQTLESVGSTISALPRGFARAAMLVSEN